MFGPAGVSLVVDKGQTGTRGNNILISQGNPNVSGNLAVEPIESDLAIDINQDSPSYLYLYRFSNSSWTPLLRLIPNSISLNKDVLFVDGSATINVQLPVPPGIIITGDVADRVDIQYSIVGYTDDINYNPTEADIFEQFLADTTIEYDAGDDYFGEDPNFFDQIIDGGSEPDILPSASIPDEALNSPIASFFEIDSAVIDQGVVNLQLTFNSILYFGNAWGPFQGEKTLHLVITVV